jgi:hypothetical protein
MDLNWWVPRKLEGSTLTYPDASLLRTRVTTPWPSRIDDASISIRPIVSDWLMGSKSTSGDGFASASGAHPFGANAKLQFGYETVNGDYFCSQIKWGCSFQEARKATMSFIEGRTRTGTTAERLRLMVASPFREPSGRWTS